jgi:hypothetical protein
MKIIEAKTIWFSILFIHNIENRRVYRIQFSRGGIIKETRYSIWTKKHFPSLAKKYTEETGIKFL